ncbi:Glycosyltransferase, GT2 family [Methanolobus vulcani]|uniref:Glycosyltransferase, GT2 family n=1 Tax=Methanolobus vulcani TaxID=38026 RepID=A0A7Z7AZH6_9EURY|nr:glycosyltransferase [Methanolobus vulcani]SDF24839.1 Glycosyltransferase, GT2 family [Methanolobus vulcani]
MKISVIIPTYNRPEKLGELLSVLSSQSHLPDEVIVVDNASNKLTKEVTSSYTSHFASCTYLFTSVNSVSIARNLGASKAHGDYLFFLDDDDIPAENYIEEIVSCFNSHPDALLVQGMIPKRKSSVKLLNQIWDNIWNSYANFFLTFRYTPCEKKVLMSGKTTSPFNCTEDANCEWASGGLTCIKKEVFKTFKYDEKLVKYCYGEDADFSYRIYLSNPKSVYIAPKAIVYTHPSLNKNSPMKDSLIMEKTYNLYFVSKNLGRPINFLLFFWSEIGLLFQDIIFAIIFANSKFNYFFNRILYSFYAYYVCLKHFSDIKNLNIELINQRYLS